MLFHKDIVWQTLLDALKCRKLHEEKGSAQREIKDFGLGVLKSRRRVMSLCAVDVA